MLTIDFSCQDPKGTHPARFILEEAHSTAAQSWYCQEDLVPDDKTSFIVNSTHHKELTNPKSQWGHPFFCSQCTIITLPP